VSRNKNPVKRYYRPTCWSNLGRLARQNQGKFSAGDAIIAGRAGLGRLREDRARRPYDAVAPLQALPTGQT